MRTSTSSSASVNRAKHVVLAALAVFTASSVAHAQCGATLSSCRQCHEVDATGPRERAVLRLTDELIDGARASDDALADVRRHLDDRAVVELVVTIGFYGLTCRVPETLGVDPEERP